MNNRGSGDSVAQTAIFRDTEITIRFNQRKSQRSLNAKEILINCQCSTTGRERLIRSNLSARFCFELSGNLN